VDGAYSEYREPDNNHYATEAFRDSLIAIANAWADSVANDSTLDNRQTPLNINDISLPNGGRFDINGEWTGSHSTHRVGRAVDIRTTRDFDNLVQGRNAVFLIQEFNIDGTPLLDARNRQVFINTKFERLSIRKGVNPDPEIHDRNTGNEHYHLYFYPND